MDYSSLISFAVGGNAYGSTADTNSRKVFVGQATNNGEYNPKGKCNGYGFIVVKYSYKIKLRL